LNSNLLDRINIPQALIILNFSCLSRLNFEYLLPVFASEFLYFMQALLRTTNNHISLYYCKKVHFSFSNSSLRNKAYFPTCNFISKLILESYRLIFFGLFSNDPSNKWRIVFSTAESKLKHGYFNSLNHLVMKRWGFKLLKRFDYVITKFYFVRINQKPNQPNLWKWKGGYCILKVIVILLKFTIINYDKSINIKYIWTISAS